MQILVDLLDCNSKLHNFLFRMVACFSKYNGLTWKKLMRGGGVFVNEDISFPCFRLHHDVQARLHRAGIDVGIYSAAEKLFF